MKIKKQQVIIYSIFGAVLLALVVGVVAWHSEKKAPEQATKVIVSPTVTPEPTKEVDYGTIDMDESHWVTYQLKTIGMEFKLPKEVSKKLGNIQEKLPQESNGKVYYVSSILHQTFIESTSKGYIPGGRSYGFGDMEGYFIQDSKYYTVAPTSDGVQKNIEVAPQTKPTEVINVNQVHMLKIHGAHIDNSSYPYPPYLNAGYLGAIVRTHNGTYPTITLYMQQTQNTTEGVFDKILSTFRFTQ